MPKALVTGGAGFIGSHITDALVRRGFKVTVIDDLSVGKRENVNSKAKFIKLSLLSPKLNATLARIKPDYIFHAAAHIDARYSVEDPEFDARTNIIGGIRLLEAARRVKIKKFIFSSTGGAIYGGARKIPTPESNPTHPFSPYGVSKLSFEQYLHCYWHLYKLPWIVLRYANVYGPRQTGHGEAGVIAVFAQKMLRGEQPIINGDGKQTRDFIYVDDVVQANLIAMKSDIRGIFNIGTGEEVSINEIFNKLKILTGADVREKHGAMRVGEERRSSLSAKKAYRKLGWQPRVTIDDGLKRTVSWF